MKSIGIITIIDYENYGNRLQNYATQEVLKELGFHVETIINDYNYNKYFKNNYLQTIKKLRENSLVNIRIIINNKIKKFIHKNKVYKCRNKRIQRFKNFTSSYILESDYIISDDNIPSEFKEKFDFFVAGSDQIWNPAFRFGSSIDFLTFADKNQRIAYAPSFGLSKIPSEYISRYKQWLLEISKLSVREEQGKKIIKELTGRDALVLIDPTLMFSKEKWLSISKESKSKPKDKYLLVYFLGAISTKYKKIIEKIAFENKLKIVNLNDINDYERYITDPGEFIDYINSASILCTDSFHGAVFSILLETPMIIFNRIGLTPSMNSRIETLLKLLKLESRKLENIKNSNCIFDIDFSHINEILEIERKKTIEYLKDALSEN